MSTYQGPLSEQHVSMGNRRFRFDGLKLGVDGPSNLIVAASKRPLDANLPQATENAVLTALGQEADPTKLQAFAQTLLPQYPVAASVLMARAAKLFVENAAFGTGAIGPLGLVGELGKAVGVGFKFQPLKGLKAIAKDAVKVGPVAFIPGAGAAVVLATGAVEAGHTKAGKKIGTDLAKNKVLNTIAKGYSSGYMQANPAFFAKTLVLGAADEALHGKNIGQAIADQGKQVSKWLSDKAKYASQVAGVPPQAVPALTAAANIAEGKPLPKDLLNAAGAVVGQALGPAATAALQQGAALGTQLAQGAPVLAQIASVKNALPPATQHAFDSGLAIQLGQHLQNKGYAAAHALLPPVAGGQVGKVLSALNAPTQDLMSTAVADVKRSLPAGAADLAHRAAAALVSTPALAQLSSTDLAKKLGVPEPIARTALASVSHEVPGSPLVHAQRLEAIVGRPSPPTPGGPDPSAVWVTQYNGMPDDGAGQSAPAAVSSYGPYPA
jgi:hypothetical protein